MAMLTTIDNIYSPYKEFKTWWCEDIRLGYNTCGYLAHTIDKICSENKALKKHYEYFDDYDHYVTNLAMDEILKNDILHVYKKVDE